ncbi:hypothetical protein OF83DRAFT_1086253 [Amylostereum chailletii]|nr:hypothetical protein OF83DRAFT_1086253 [Amylostereum chailletii]
MATSASSTAPVASTSKPPSKRFTEIYAGLSPDIQRAFVEKHLALLLDELPQGSQKAILDTAEETRARYVNMPNLDFDRRSQELDSLLSLRDDDAKRTVAKEESIREEITGEIVRHVANWLSDIWSVGYEYKTSFALAHKCLIRTAEVLTLVQLMDSGCRCDMDNFYVDVVIRRRKTFKTVKTFQLTGIRSLERVILWIWRDLFLAMLASNNANASLIADMLEDIRSSRGWPAVHHVLSGGKGGGYGCNDDYHDDEEDEDDETDEEEGHGEWEEGQEEVVDDDNDDAWSDDMPPLESLPEDLPHQHVHSNPMSATHWPPIISAQTSPLRQIVLDYLLTLFESAPEIALYHAIKSLSQTSATRTKLLDNLESVALTSSDAFVTALDVYSIEGLPDRLWRIIHAGAHLLRPRDYGPYQRAVVVLGHSRLHRARALAIATTEIFDTARSVRASLLSSFTRLDDPARTKELFTLLRTGANAVSRPDRIDAWIDGISTPGSDFPHPFSFAAMMMGIPIPPISPEDGADALLDLDRDDGVLADLREDLRPNMKDRFESWVEIISKLGKTADVLARLYVTIAKIMPYLAAADVVDAMVGRLADKPAKHYICDGLDALNAFAKGQRRKAAATMAKTKKMQEAKAAQAEEAKARNASASTPAAGPSGSQAQQPSPSTLRQHMPYLSSTFNGIDDVD